MGYNDITELKTTNELIGKMFLEATRLELGVTKVTDEATVDLAQRTIELALIYKNKILKNNRIHNRLIHGWVKEDYLFCSNQTKVFIEKINRYLDEKHKQ